MKAKITIAILFGTAALLSEVRAQDITLETARPVVVKSVPQSGADDVDPSLTEISVAFSKPMKAGSWSWVMMSKESYPGTADAPKYLDDKKTCVLPTKLQPGKTYAVWINSEKLQNFKDATGNIAVPYLVVFRTRDK
ncbi:MAG TPA: Ig-like domain-containing protein [Chthoniobacterales bacterium]|nr:Ig-like domain-containing protein [Chthoniobacterales bacterium]